MKKEDIERRRNDRGKMIEMKVGLGQRLDTSKNADIEKRYGPGAIDTFNLKADRIKEERETSLAADATKKRRDTQKFVWERQTQALAKANSIGDMLKKMENPLTGGVRPETRETYSHLTKNWNELLKQAGIDVEGYGSLSQKDKEAQAKDAFLEKATVAYNAALKDPTDENIMAFKQANNQGKVLKDMRFDVFDEATLTKRQTEKKKDEQKAKVAEAKRKQGMEDFRKKELFKQDLRAGEDDSEFAPDTNLYRNAETGATKDIDTRDKNAIAQAAAEGFFPIGPRAKGYLTQSGKFGAEREKEIVAGSVKARGKIATLNTLDTLLDRFRSGKLANIGKGIQQWASAFGIPVSKSLGAKEAFGAIVNELALRSRNLGEGMVLAGQMSDKDVQFLKDMNVQMIISKGGNKLILKIRKSIAQRELDIAREVSNYKKQNRGVFDGTGFEDFIRNKYSSKHIFGIPAGSVLTGTDTVTGLPVYEKDGKYFIPDF